MDYCKKLSRRIAPGLPYLVAFDKVVYDSLSESIRARRDQNKALAKTPNFQESQLHRIVRLESTANALYEGMLHNPNGSISFLVSRAIDTAREYQKIREEQLREKSKTREFNPNPVSEASLKRDAAAFMRFQTKMDEKRGVWMRFRVVYSKQDKIGEYGYALPMESFRERQF